MVFNTFQNKRFLIFGANGQLGVEFKTSLETAGIFCQGVDLPECDITDREALSACVTAANPDIVINCAAANAVDALEDNPELADRVNHQAVKNISNVCAEREITFVHYGTDYVFDGEKGAPYTEDDVPHPLNEYGRSKLRGEQAALDAGGKTLVFRLSWVIGPGEQNFLFKLNQWAAKNTELNITSDEVSVPTFTSTIVDVTLKALARNLTGLYHLTNSGYCSRYELAREYVTYKGMTTIVKPVPMSFFQTKARRPLFSAMDNTKLCRAIQEAIPSWQDGLRRYCKER